MPFLNKKSMPVLRFRKLWGAKKKNLRMQEEEAITETDFLV